MIIGIGGISRAGKTNLAKLLKNDFMDSTYIVHLDHYIKDSSHWNFFTRYPVFYLSKLYFRFDMEHPYTIDFDRMIQDILQYKMQYKNVIVEGFLVAHDQRVKKLLNKYIHVQISKNEFMKRRMNDYKKNNTWYAKHVWSSYMKFGNNYQDLNHIVLHADKFLDREGALRFLNDKKFQEK